MGLFRDYIYDRLLDFKTLRLSEAIDGPIGSLSRRWDRELRGR